MGRSRFDTPQRRSPRYTPATEEEREEPAQPLLARGDSATLTFLMASALVCALMCVSCDKIMCEDYDFVNESDYHIEYTMTKIDDKDTIEAHESYTRHLSQDLGVVITNSAPVYCVETSTSATFREYQKYTYTITNKCAFTVTLGTSHAFDTDFTVPSKTASGNPSVVTLYSNVLQLKDPPGGVAVLATTWSGNKAAVTVSAAGG